jgi:IS30 family transposase
MSYTHLTPTERGQIQALRQEGRSLRYIADRLGRHISTISRELRRNMTRKGYKAQQAQHQYHQRRESCHPIKRLEYRALWHYLIEKLVQGWTPEEVAGRLPTEYPNDPRMRISHECIYQSIYSDKRLHFLIKCLVQGRPKRRKRGQGKSRRGPTIPNRVGIEHRPVVVEERSRYGDWEGDTVVGAQQQGYLVTLVERRSRLLQSRKVQTKQADEVAQAVIDALEELPTSWVKTITFDNGTEFTRHEDMAKVLPVDIYFATPYSSYQRGTNENTNGLIRRYLPKGTSFRDLSQKQLDRSFRDLSQKQLDRIVYELNNRPRKILGYRTPNEVFQEQRKNHRIALSA